MKRFWVGRFGRDVGAAAAGRAIAARNPRAWKEKMAIYSGVSGERG